MRGSENVTHTWAAYIYREIESNYEIGWRRPAYRRKPYYLVAFQPHTINNRSMHMLHTTNEKQGHNSMRQIISAYFSRPKTLPNGVHILIFETLIFRGVEYYYNCDEGKMHIAENK